MKLILREEKTKKEIIIDNVERYYTSDEAYEIHIFFDDGHEEVYNMGEYWAYPDPSKYPKEIIIRNRRYKQQYQTNDGMYYETEEELPTEAERLMFSSFVQLHNDGRITYLWNGNESTFANYDFESGIITYK